ncbi:hypothetical protein [Pseudomonas sp. AN3A02]|uniref:hypothetical protein n=1 Tax=Pseudomonas sp. AN3A02 TaxID=2719587 RepID=UPI001432271E|nr:hypothetical protein [Pseudomonas sp. AN3A02]NIL20052.1 hypothetical protein [Pseudomonas sp. AN3A02]
MTDLICRKSMTRCQTPGMCSPHGGCQAPETASAFRSLLAERNSLAFLLKRFVDGENDQDENQAERHMYHDEAQSLLAFLGGDLPGHTLVPDEALRNMNSEIARLKTLVQAEIDIATERAKEVMGARMTLYTLEQDLIRLKAALKTLRHHDRVTADQAQIIDAAIAEQVATPSTDNENVSRHEER